VRIGCVPSELTALGIANIPIWWFVVRLNWHRQTVADQSTNEPVGHSITAKSETNGTPKESSRALAG
jgi:hypothetical protein